MPAPNSTPARFHEVALRPSKRLRQLFWIANGLGLLAIFLSSAPLLLKLAVLLVQMVVGWRFWRFQLAERSALRIVGLRWCKGQYQLRVQGGERWEKANLLPNSRCWPGWLVLYFRLDVRSGQKRRQLILPADAGDPEALRRLQLLLRYPPRARSDSSSGGSWPE